MNAFAERFVRSIKDECLSRVVPLSERYLNLLVREYVEHYHRERNHQGLGNELLNGAPKSAKAGVKFDAESVSVDSSTTTIEMPHD